MNWEEKFNKLIRKTEKLVEQNRKIQQENELLEKELNELKQQLASERDNGKELLNKIKIIKLAQNIGSAKTEEDAGVAELKRKINEYIKEIDQCLTMLNN